MKLKSLQLYVTWYGAGVLELAGSVLSTLPGLPVTPTVHTACIFNGKPWRSFMYCGTFWSLYPLAYDYHASQS